MDVRLRVSMGFSNKTFAADHSKDERWQLDAAVRLNLESMSVSIIDGAESLGRWDDRGLGSWQDCFIFFSFFKKPSVKEWTKTAWCRIGIRKPIQLCSSEIPCAVVSISHGGVMFF